MDEAVSAARRDFARLGLALFAAALSVVAAQYAVSFAARAFFPAALESVWFTYAMLALNYAVAIPALYLLLRPSVRFAARAGSLDALSLAALFPIGMLACYALSALGGALSSLINSLLGSGYVNPVSQAVSGAPIWLVALATVLLAPLCEEFIFRHLVLDALRPYGERTAALVSSLAFALFHFNLTQALYAFAVGLLLSYTALKAGGIAQSALLHSLINLFGSVLVPALTASGEGTAYRVGMGLVLGLCAAGAALLALLARRARLAGPPASLERPLTARDKYLNVGFIAFFALSAVMFASSALSGN